MYATETMGAVKYQQEIPGLTLTDVKTETMLITNHRMKSTIKVEIGVYTVVSKHVCLLGSCFYQEWYDGPYFIRHLRGRRHLEPLKDGSRRILFIALLELDQMRQY